jgi:hypothetical protein
VDGDGVDALAVEPGRQARGGQLGPREDQHLVQVAASDQVGEEGLLAVAIDRVDQLADALDSGVARRDLDGLRIAQDRPGQAPDVVRERGREHEVLAALRQELDDALDIGQETHVQHAVSLVKDEDLDLAQVRDLLPDQVEQPARRGDEDLDPGAQRLDLWLHGDAAVDDRRAERHGPPVRPDALVDLHRQLARGDEDQGAHRMACGGERRVRVRPEAVEDRERECGRLAGTRLRGREDVASGEDERDGRFLDRCRGGVALFGDGLE